MTYQEAQAVILRAVENPDADVSTEQLARAIAVVLVRSGMLGAVSQTVTMQTIGNPDAI